MTRDYKELLRCLREHSKRDACANNCICEDADKRGYASCSEELAKLAADAIEELLLSVEMEPLTDKEQRIFLAAMEREEKVCKQVDKECCREPYEDSLVRICHEITRKVKGALWTI